MKKQIKTTLIIITIIVIVLIVWGLIGSSQAAKIGIDCDLGIDKDGSIFCWTWHKNVIGEVGDTLNNLFDK
jgi:hypothetical protein